MSLLIPIKLFAPVALATTDVLLFTVPTPATTILQGGGVRFVSQDAASRTVTVFAVPKGDVSATVNELVSAATLAVGAYMDVAVGNLEEGDKIIAKIDSGTSVIAHPLGGTLWNQ